MLAPDPVSISVAVTTTATKTVAPRDYYLYYLRGDPSFRYDERLTLVDFVNDQGSWSPRSVVRAARDLGVDAVCLDRADIERAAVLTRAGYVPLALTSAYRCLAPGRGSPDGVQVVGRFAGLGSRRTASRKAGMHILVRSGGGT